MYTHAHTRVLVFRYYYACAECLLLEITYLWLLVVHADHKQLAAVGPATSCRTLERSRRRTTSSRGHRVRSALENEAAATATAAATASTMFKLH